MPKRTKVDLSQLEMDDLLPDDHPRKPGKINDPPRISKQRLKALEARVKLSKEYNCENAGTYIVYHDLGNLIGELKWRRRQMKRSTK